MLKPEIKKRMDIYKKPSLLSILQKRRDMIRELIRDYQDTNVPDDIILRLEDSYKSLTRQIFEMENKHLYIGSH